MDKKIVWSSLSEDLSQKIHDLRTKGWQNEKSLELHKDQKYESYVFIKNDALIMKNWSSINLSSVHLILLIHTYKSIDYLRKSRKDHLKQGRLPHSSRALALYFKNSLLNFFKVFTLSLNSQVKLYPCTFF